MISAYIVPLTCTALIVEARTVLSRAAVRLAAAPCAEVPLLASLPLPNTLCCSVRAAQIADLGSGSAVEAVAEVVFLGRGYSCKMSPNSLTVLLCKVICKIEVEHHIIVAVKL